MIDVVSASARREQSASRPLLRVSALNKRFGGVIATDNVSFDVHAGEIHALIGPNGAGKTTMISQLCGELAPDSGKIMLDGENITALQAHIRAQRGLARSFQITQLLQEDSALDNVALAVQARQGHSFHFWSRAREDASLRHPAMEYLEHAGLAERAHLPVSELSHGEHKQLELAIALSLKPRLLLLDEPMAGLGASESQAMIASLQKLRGSISILLVEHDMDAVFALADRISVLVYGQIIATGSVEEIQANAQVREAYLGEGGA